MFYTGLRVGEVVALKSGDISGNYVTVSRAEQQCFRLAKDGITMSLCGQMVTDDVKTAAAYRDVYVVKQGRDVLNAALHMHPAPEDEDFFPEPWRTLQCHIHTIPASEILSKARNIVTTATQDQKELCLVAFFKCPKFGQKNSADSGT